MLNNLLKNCKTLQYNFNLDRLKIKHWNCLEIGVFLNHKVKFSLNDNRNPNFLIHKKYLISYLKIKN